MNITAATIKKYIGGVQTKITETTLAPFISVALSGFKRTVGAQLFEYLPSASQELLECAQACVCWAAYDLALPQLKIRVGDLGIAKNVANNTVALTKWEYVDTREANMAMVDMFWEMFWETLELEMPDAWKNSAAYVKHNSLFLRSADELGRYAPLVGRNRRFFADLVKFIERAESLYIEDVLTAPVLLTVKTKFQAGTLLTPVEVMLIEKIRFALAYLTLHEAYPYLPLIVDQEGLRQVRKKDGTREEDIAEKPYRQAQRAQLWQDSQLYLGQIRKFMDTYASQTVFPEYYTDKIAASSCDQIEDYTHKPHVTL